MKIQLTPQRQKILRTEVMDEHKDNYDDIATLETAYHKLSVSAPKGLGEPNSIEVMWHFQKLRNQLPFGTHWRPR